MNQGSTCHHQLGDHRLEIHFLQRVGKIPHTLMIELWRQAKQNQATLLLVERSIS
jgi:hypothetical protein